jgi:hypothetical protein
MSKRLQAIITLILTLCFLSVGMGGCVTNTQSYEFKTGVNHDKVVSGMMKNVSSTVVLFIYHNCTRCEGLKLKMEDLQSQMQGVGDKDLCKVRRTLPPPPFAVFLYEDIDVSSWGLEIAKNYNVQQLPTIIVTRGDGAIATFIPTQNELDTSSIKSAIEESLKWQQTHPTLIPKAVTPNPPADYSSYLTSSWESGSFIIERAFTKSISERGNDVYKGIGRNASKPGSKSVTIVIELTKSKNESKQLYDNYVGLRLSEGYAPRPDWGVGPDNWVGQQYSSGYEFRVSYDYRYDILSWEVTMQAI